MNKRKKGVIMERYCPIVDSNVVILKNMVKNDGSYQCISHTHCGNRERCPTLPPLRQTAAALSKGS